MLTSLTLISVNCAKAGSLSQAEPDRALRGQESTLDLWSVNC
jgi:hypothetical protein